MPGFELIRLAKGSLIYGIGGVLQRFIGLLLLPFFTRVLTPGEYGIMALISLVRIGFTGAFNLGTGNSMGLLYYNETDLSKRPVIIWSCAIMLLIVNVTLIAILISTAPLLSSWVFETTKYAGFFKIAFITMGFTTIIDPFYAYLRMEEKSKQYVVLTLVSTLSTIALSVIFVLIMRWGVLGLLLASLIGQVFMLAIVAFSVARKIPFGINNKLFAPLVRIGFPSIFGLFAFLIIDYADRQMLQRMTGLDQLGIYSIGYNFGMVMMVAVNAFASAWPPFFMSFINRREDAKVIFGKVLKYYIIGFGLLSVIFFALAKPIVFIAVAPAFKTAFTVIGMVAAAYMLKGCYLIFLPGIYFAKKLKYQSIIEWTAAILNICLNLWWIPIYGIVGAAGATLLSYFSLPILSCYISRRYLVVDYDWSKIGMSSLAIVACSAALFHVSSINSWAIFATYSSVISFALIITLFFTGLSSFERRLVFDKIYFLIRKS